MRSALQSTSGSRLIPGLSRRLLLKRGISTAAVAYALGPASADACHLTKTCWQGDTSTNTSTSTSTTSGGKTIYAGNYSQLKSAFAKIPSGGTIRLKNGTFSGSGTLKLSTSNVRIVAVNRLKAIIACNLDLAGGRITLEGVHMRGRSINSRGAYNRITRCRSTDAGTAINLFSGGNARVDHCEIMNWRYRGIHVRPKSGARNVIIEKNYFTNTRKVGGACIGLGASRHDSPVRSNAYVQYNLIYNNKSNDSAIMCKSSYNTIRHNTLLNSTYCYNRHGDYNKYIANWIENSKGIFLNDLKCKAIGNEVRSCVQGIQVAGGNIKPSQSQYYDNKWPYAEGTKLSGNRANRTAIGVSYSWSPRLPARNIIIEKHTGPIKFLNVKGVTRRSGSSESIPKAYKLARSKVGVNAS